jgi:hypothetical protein
MFVDVTCETASTKRIKKPNRSETTYQHKICRASDDGDERCAFMRQSVCQETCRLVTSRLRYTHINHLCTVPSIFGGITKPRTRTHVYGEGTDSGSRLNKFAGTFASFGSLLAG